MNTIENKYYKVHKYRVNVPRMPYECCICYTSKKLNTYYKCDFHFICNICYIKLKNCNNYKHCPMCKSDIKLEHKKPNDLSMNELMNLETKKINFSNINVHSDLNIDKSMLKVIVNINNTKKVEFYFKNGNFMNYKFRNELFFIGSDGFLYEYNNKKNTYVLAIRDNKFQYWDVENLMQK